MGAHGALAAAGRIPGIEPPSKLTEHFLGSDDLLLEESLHVQARAGASAAERNDSADFAEREAQSPRLGHECEDGQYVVRVEPIAGRCSTRRRQNAARLVDLKCLRRIEQLTLIRRQMEGARLEHVALVGDLEDTRPLRRSFLAKAERLREAGIALLFDQLVADRRATLDRLRQQVAAINGSGDEDGASTRPRHALGGAVIADSTRALVMGAPGSPDVQ